MTRTFTPRPAAHLLHGHLEYMAEKLVQIGFGRQKVQRLNQHFRLPTCQFCRAAMQDHFAFENPLARLQYPDSPCQRVLLLCIGHSASGAADSYRHSDPITRRYCLNRHEKRTSRRTTHNRCAISANNTPRSHPRPTPERRDTGSVCPRGEKVAGRGTRQSSGHATPHKTRVTGPLMRPYLTLHTPVF